jgi:hypothetical protein
MIRLLVCFLALVMTQLPLAAQKPQPPSPLDRPFEDRLVTLVKGTPAKDYDGDLPKLRFERWLLDVAGPKVALEWELNDCGEQTGDPAVDSKRDIPACVGVLGTLADGRKFQILVAVGVIPQGSNAIKPRGKPAIREIIVEWNGRIHQVARLRDLPKLLQPEEPKKLM